MAEHRSISLPLQIERREDGPDTLTGYAAVFYDAGDPGTEFQFGPFRERVLPSAFRGALKRPDDVRALFNHSADNLLGRTSSGTLKLETDRRGLRYTIQIGTRLGDEVLRMAERGDLTGSSFGFVATDERFVDGRDGEVVRELRGVELLDVGPVTFPAYASTTAEARAACDQLRNAWIEHRLRILRLHDLQRDAMIEQRNTAH